MSRAFSLFTVSIPKPRRAYCAAALGLTVAVFALMAFGDENQALPSHKGQTESEAGSADEFDLSFFEKCVFVSVDLQDGHLRNYKNDAELPENWRRMGFKAQDCNTANRFLVETAKPNARRVADACRRLGLPMVFLHWGYRFEDGMDLDPPTRRNFQALYGSDYKNWPHHISHPSSRPAEILDVRPGEYVIPKTGQDAFTSSNLGYVLKNMGAKNIVFVGGHAGGCLGHTARHAKGLGYGVLCVSDATWDVAESRRMGNLTSIRGDYLTTTDSLLAFAEQFVSRRDLADRVPEIVETPPGESAGQAVP